MKRPPIYKGCTVQISTTRGTLFITVNGDPPQEVFLRASKGGTDLQGLTEAIGRLISIALRYKVPLEVVTDQLVGIKTQPFFSEGIQYLSIPDAVGKALNEVRGEGSKESGRTVGST